MDITNQTFKELSLQATLLCPDQEHSDTAKRHIEIVSIEFSIWATRAVLSVINLLAVFTPISALQLLCGNATDDIR